MTMNASGGRDNHGTMDITLEPMEMIDSFGIVFENPISIDLIKYGIAKAVSCSFGGVVVWEDQDGVGPLEPFVSLRIEDIESTARSDPDYNFEGNEDVREFIGDREYKVTMTAWCKNGSKFNSMEILEDIKSYINNEQSCEYIGLAKSVFIEAPRITNLSQIDGIRNVERSQMVVTFRTYAQYRRDLSHISQVNMTNRYDLGTSIKEIYTEIKEY